MTSPYVELQVHGPVEFAKDVARIVIDRKYEGSIYAKKLRLFAKKNGIPVWWHDGQRSAPESLSALA